MVIEEIYFHSKGPSFACAAFLNFTTHRTTLHIGIDSEDEG